MQETKTWPVESIPRQARRYEAQKQEHTCVAATAHSTSTRDESALKCQFGGFAEGPGTVHTVLPTLLTLCFKRVSSAAST